MDELTQAEISSIILDIVETYIDIHSGYLCSRQKSQVIRAIDDMEELKLSEEIIQEVFHRGEKEWANDGHEFTVTITQEMWKGINV